MTSTSSLIFVQGLDYSSGVWQFEGYGFVPNGTSGATIAQIHGAAHGDTTFILRIYDGDWGTTAEICWLPVCMTSGFESFDSM